MTLQQFESGLKAACPETYEYAAPPGAQRYVVWTQYGRQPIIGDDRNEMDIPKVQLDIVTNINHDPLADDICAALWLMDLPYEVISEGYDPEYTAFRTILQLVVT